MEDIKKQALQAQKCENMSDFIVYRVRDLICVFFGIMLVLIFKKQKKDKKINAISNETETEKNP